MKIGWLMGWAVPAAWFAPLVRKALPGDEHRFIEATPRAIAQLEAEGPYDWIVGYSLGAHLLLDAAERVSQWGQVTLLAPIFAFPREADLGGRIAKTQVRHLARWWRRDPAGALADFYQRAGLDVPAGMTPLATTEELLWGLERLENGSVPPPLPTGWRAWCGANDPLLDAAHLGALSVAIKIVPDGTHHPAALIDVWAKEVRSPTPVSR